MKPVIVGASALREWRDAADYYEERSAGVSNAFQQEVIGALKRIQATPELYSVYKRSEYRTCLLQDRFPYAIIYLNFSDHVWIAAIAHSSRRPGYWLGRQPGDDI